MVAKKRVSDEQTTETDETQAIEQEQPVNTGEAEAQNQTLLFPNGDQGSGLGFTPDDLTVQPINFDMPVAREDPTWTANADEQRYGVSFSLPRGVLVALLDPAHEMADVAGAEHYGLVDAYGLTAIGELVAGSFDAVAVRHKMNAAAR